MCMCVVRGACVHVCMRALFSWKFVFADNLRNHRLQLIIHDNAAHETAKQFRVRGELGHLIEKEILRIKEKLIV